MNSCRSIVSRLVFLAFALSASPLVAQTIPNPSFELQNFTTFPGTINVNAPITGWTGSATNEVGLNPAGAARPFADNGATPQGKNVAFLQTIGGRQTLSTTITGLTVGTHYRVQFRANSRVGGGGAAPVAAVALNGGPDIPFTASPPVNAAGVFTSSYYTINSFFTATGATASLVLSNSAASDSTLLVDNFIITAATPITVTNANDSGAGSLRAALATAAGSATTYNVINFAAALSGQTITLLSELAVTDASGVVIDGSSLAGGIKISGGSASRVFNIATGTNCILRKLTLTNGGGSSGSGGAIYNNGTLALEQCTLTANSALNGGAIFNDLAGNLSLTQCTLTGNSTTENGGEGGAIRNLESGTITLTQCTISDNSSSAGYGGGMTNRGSLTLINTILAQNSAGVSTAGADVDNYKGSVTRVGANIVNALENGSGGGDTGPAAINSNPLLSALSDNGGPTQTMAIAYTSPARNAAVDSTVTTDQRGLPVVGTPDIGAFEMQAGVFTLSAATYKTSEGFPATITINRSAGFSGTATVRVYTSNGTAGAADFTARPNTAASDVTFLDGDSTKDVVINTTQDELVEGNETFSVSLGSPTPAIAAMLGSPSTATVTIMDTIQVTNTNDDGAGSLRQAIADAKANPGPGRINFAPALNGKVISLNSEIEVTDSGGVTVDASALATGLKIDGGPGTNRIFSLSTSGSTLNLSGLTLTGGGGDGSASSGLGGAIFVSSGASLTMTRCTLSGNSSGGGGGAIANEGGTVGMTQCTISGNNTSGDGGAIENGGFTPGSTVELIHCTIAENTAIGPCQGVIIQNGQLTASNSIFTHSEGSYGLVNFGNLTRVGANVMVDVFELGVSSGPLPITSDPMLGPLASNGGPTQTMALMANSPARNAAVGSSIVSDQRGKAVVGTPDIGAFEAQPGGVFALNQTGYSTAEGGSVTVTIVRAPGLAGAAKVRLFTTAGTASASDFTARPNTTASDIDFLEGDATKSLVINTSTDALVEANETFTVTLSLPAPVAPGVTLGSPSSATVAIIDPSSNSNVSDTMAPGVPVITTPAANAILNVDVGGTATITGTATDNKGVFNVFASVNSGTPYLLTLTSPGAPSTAFSGPLTGLVAGSNTVLVIATDFANRSTTSLTRSFNVWRPLLVTTSGNGTVTSGFSPSSFREVGQKVTITATPGSAPAPGALFAGWTIVSLHMTDSLGILPSALGKPTLTVIHRQGLVLRANFVPNTFNIKDADGLTLGANAAGVSGVPYNGLIRRDSGDEVPRNSTEGLFTATVMSSGAFSATCTIDGTMLTCAGAFDPNGVARFGTSQATTCALARANKPSLIVSFTIDVSSFRTKDTISGHVISSSFANTNSADSTFTADRAYYDGLTPATTVPSDYLGAAGATQAYTLRLPPSGPTDPAFYPQGNGYGFLTITKAGVVTLTSGKLADGTPITGSSRLSKDKMFPLFLQLYNKLGFARGDVVLDSTQHESDMSSPGVDWLRPLDTTSQYFPYGWGEDPDFTPRPSGLLTVGLEGARYVTSFAPAGSVLLQGDGSDVDFVGDPLPPVDPLNGNATLVFSLGQLSDLVFRFLNVTTTNVITNAPTSDTSFTLAFDVPSGKFSGKFVHENDEGAASPPMTDFEGALYQKGIGAGGSGFFLTRKPNPIDYLGQSGGVFLDGGLP